MGRHDDKRDYQSDEDSQDDKDDDRRRRKTKSKSHHRHGSSTSKDRDRHGHRSKSRRRPRKDEEINPDEESAVKEKGRDRDGDRDDKKNRKRSRREQSSSQSDSSRSSASASSRLDDDSSVESSSNRRDKKHSSRDKKHKKKSSAKENKKDKKSSKRKKKSKTKRKHHDKEERDSRKKHKKSHNKNHDNDESDKMEFEDKARNYALAEALHELLVEHPTVDMATNTLPLVLIKLGGGTTLDLRHMPNQRAAQGLKRVLQTLQTFGVTEEEPQVWKWAVPGGNNSSTRDERILLRIVRTLLNDIGFTMDAIDQYSNNQQNAKASIKDGDNQNNSENNSDKKDHSELVAIRDHTSKLLQSFQEQQKQQNNNKDSTAPSTLPGELGGLCKMILEGESIALDGLPDANLRTALEQLFQSCGLELFEMDDEEEDDNEDENGAKDDIEKDNETKSMGYGLPETEEKQELVRDKIFSVISACEQAASAGTASSARAARALKGPTPMPANYQAPEESSDEEGPAPVGLARRKEPAVSKELIRLQAEMRARQLKGAVTGQEELMSTDPTQREEWMLVPGKFDFLSSIKAGNPMRSRNFKAQSKAGQPESSGRVMDPKIKAEMDAIMQAHSDARGPTLVEQHRQKREQERRELEASGGNKGKWKWTRDKDLDSGRRVDKSALNMVLGGATKDLKNKFQGGF